jgi:hypothetical protein
MPPPKEVKNIQVDKLRNLCLLPKKIISKISPASEKVFLPTKVSGVLHSNDSYQVLQGTLQNK